MRGLSVWSDSRGRITSPAMPAPGPPAFATVPAWITQTDQRSESASMSCAVTWVDRLFEVSCLNIPVKDRTPFVGKSPYQPGHRNDQHCTLLLLPCEPIGTRQSGAPPEWQEGQNCEVGTHQICMCCLYCLLIQYWLHALHCLCL